MEFIGILLNLDREKNKIGSFFFPVIFAISTFVFAGAAHAQRAQENAIAEAADAFGTTVGREEIGLYSANSARGFSPSQAGNLRIDGLYFDQVSRLAGRIVRGSTVHVGISAQGFPFPAPTGVVDFHLRTPTDEMVGSALLGYASYGEQAYGEFDFQAPVISDVLSIGGGVGYTRNSSYHIATLSDEWTAGLLARWQPTESLIITPFWSTTKHLEYGERSHVFIGNSGYPEFRSVDLMAQPWADFGVSSSNFGSTVLYSFGDSWHIAAGLFLSQSSSNLNIDPLLLNTNSLGQGDYFLSEAPPRDSRSTSGEIRLAKKFNTEKIRNTLYFSVKGRDRRSESGGADTISIGPGTTLAVPQVAMPDFNPGPTTLVEVQQYTPGVAFEGVWRDIGQLSLGVQKTFYDRIITAPNSPSIASSSSPWLYNVGAAAYISRKLVVYASYTRGFEEIGSAPLNAVNNGEAVPAQLTEQVDAGIKYQILSGLQLVAGVFEIKKPYFDLDQVNVFRQVGSTSNRGVELSLAGGLSDGLTAVVGAILIDAQVKLDDDIGGSGSTSTVAIGPIPELFRANFQYRVAAINGLFFDAKIEHKSERYARANTVRLPSVTTINIGVRYNAQMFGKSMTLRLQGLNLTDEFGLNPSSSGKIQPFDSRGFAFSFALDL